MLPRGVPIESNVQRAPVCSSRFWPCSLIPAAQQNPSVAEAIGDGKEYNLGLDWPPHGLKGLASLFPWQWADRPTQDEMQLRRDKSCQVIPFRLPLLPFSIIGLSLARSS